MKDWIRRYRKYNPIDPIPLKGRWDCVVCIPVCREENLFCSKLFPSLRKAAEFSGCRILILVLVNQGKQPIFSENAKIWEEASKESCYQEDGFISVLWIDRFSTEKLQLDFGVGEARRILGDIALDLYVQGKIQKDFFFCLDADAAVEENYFLAEEVEEPLGIGNPNLRVGLYHFHHVEGEIPLAHATGVYEQYLLSLEEGLAFAKSPYAYTSLGSTLSPSFDCYAAVGGFPKLHAGEDFYFLNAAAKIGRIKKKDSTVFLQSRVSNRTPYGTGQRVGKILMGDLPPSLGGFEILKQWLEVMPHLSRWDSFFRAYPEAKRILLDLRILKRLEAIADFKEAQRVYQSHGIFDALKTYQFLKSITNSDCRAPLGRDFRLNGRIEFAGNSAR